MTLLTDYALAVLTFFFAHRLLRAARRRQQISLWFWSGAFFASALASLLGGTYHGWETSWDHFQHILLWKGTVVSIGCASLFMLCASITAVISPPLRQWFFGVASLKFLFYSGWMFWHDDFFYVVCDYGGSMALVLVLQILQITRRRDKNIYWIMLGIGASFLAAGVQQSGMTLHPAFNHNDLYHVIQMGAFYLLYRGGLSLSDYAPSSLGSNSPRCHQNKAN